MTDERPSAPATFESGTLVRNISLTTVTMLLRVVIAAGSLALISRHVSPSAMGLYGIGWAAASFGFTLSQSGAAQAIIALGDLDKEHVAAAQFLSIVIALAAAVIVIVATPLIAAFYATDGVAYAFVLGALSIPLMSLGSVDIARAQKELQFSRLAVIQTLGMLFSALAALLLAFLGFALLGLFALQGLVGLFVFLLSRYYWPSPGFGRFSRQHLSDVWKIGIHLSLGSLTAVIWQNIPQLVLAKILPMHEIGLYTFCNRIVQLVFGLLSGMVNSVIYPTFAKLQNSPRDVGRAFLKTVKFTYFCVMLPLLVLAAAPHAFLYVYGGPQWDKAGTILFFLVLMQMAMALGANVFPTFAALGRPSVAWRWNLFIALVQGTTVVILAPFGMTAVVQGMAATALIMPLAVFWLSRTAHFRMADYARNMAVVVTAALPAMFAGNRLPTVFPAVPLGQLIMASAAAAVTYTILVIALDRNLRSAVQGHAERLLYARKRAV